MIRLEEGARREATDEIPSEARVALELNGEKTAAFSCSPRDLVELGVGYLVSSGFLHAREELHSVQVLSGCDIIIDVRAAARSGPKGVGPRRQGSRLPRGLVFRAEALLARMEELLERGELFRRTGGTHFAAVIDCDDCDQACKPGTFFEDIGRYNAIDKAVGGAFLAGLDLRRAGLAVSCRVSSDAVRKAVGAGVALVLSRAGPTAEGVALAREAGVTLAGFARENRMNVYTHEERIVWRDVAQVQGETPCERDSLEA